MPALASSCQRRARAARASSSWRGRQVDADDQVPARRGPRAAPAAGARARQQLAAERHDQPALLGERDEVVRGRRGRARVRPAHERLDAGDRAGRACRRSAGSASSSSSRSSARRRSASSARRSTVAGQHRRLERAVAALAAAPWPRTSRGRRRAASSSASDASPPETAMPMLALDVERGVRRASTGRESASRIRSATPVASRGSARSSSSTANSSPPSRATVSAGREHARAGARPTATQQLVAAAWPRVSLTALKSSRSTNRTAIGAAGRGARQRVRRCGRTAARGWPAR